MASIEDKYKISDCSPVKKYKEDRLSSHRKNFHRACKLESEKAYLNYTERLQMMFIPNCSTVSNCKHVSRKIRRIAPRVINSIQMELSGNMWYEALEISYLCITPKQCLTVNVLKDIVEIMLNAHEDVSSKYSITHIISKCEQVLALHFRMHPPCGLHNEVLYLYNSFLMDPMIASNKNDKKHSTRNDYGCDKGIIQYCFNRLESEISSKSQDGPLINKDQIIPENLKDSLQGLHFEKEQLEIYELLERTDRIDRLIAVLRSTIELLQFNLYILKSRQLRQKMLMHKLFLPIETQYKVPIISKQIIKLFAYFVHLDYPAEHVKIMSIWLNIAVEAHISYDFNSCSNYPNLGLYGNGFANEFYNTISDLPHESIIKILDKIKPNYMKCTVGLIYCNSCLSYDEENIINVLIKFLETTKWNDFPKNDSVKLLKKISEKAEILPSNIINHLSKICKNVPSKSNNNMTYPKFHSNGEREINQDIIINALYISLEAYLESYNVKNVNVTLEKINNSEIVSEGTTSAYTANADLFKVYTNIYHLLPKLILILNDLKKDKQLPKIFKVFEKLKLDEYIINELKLVSK
ncbi:uncharacterized protein LOC126768646 isoform X2 [Nymphalis io]|uniref:uncharacterized protein LOC126768646 isoform X2 n=1 Tax=Inachis io TaxID=171585 RepID=UPI00216A4FF2|nr:uncharacterized protein LOC126768646 isoform X2 [Nymphalis io]